jgi:hypothetical protein
VQPCLLASCFTFHRRLPDGQGARKWEWHGARGAVPDPDPCTSTSTYEFIGTMQHDRYRYCALIPASPWETLPLVCPSSGHATSVLPLVPPNTCSYRHCSHSYSSRPHNFSKVTHTVTPGHTLLCRTVQKDQCRNDSAKKEQCRSDSARVRTQKSECIRSAWITPTGMRASQHRSTSGCCASCIVQRAARKL